MKWINSMVNVICQVSQENSKSIGNIGFLSLLMNSDNFFFEPCGFSVALVPILKLALVDHADLELTGIHLPL